MRAKARAQLWGAAVVELGFEAFADFLKHVFRKRKGFAEYGGILVKSPKLVPSRDILTVKRDAGQWLQRERSEGRQTRGASTDMHAPCI